MNKIYEVAIVGGGASGLFSAIELLRGDNALSGDSVVILERNDRVGKKLIATGNGQGNLTNAEISENNYDGDKNFIKEFVSAEKETDLKNYLKSLGIFLTEDGSGKIYPLSKQASAVLDIIRSYLESKKVEIITSFKVDKIARGAKFNLYSGEREISAKKVILATGGSAGKQFGTDGSSYSLSEYFGHKKTTLYPSLVQLKTDLNLIRGLKGIKERARVTAFDGEKPLKSSTGDVLFTEFGVSGSAVFDVSGSVVKAKKPFVLLEFLPELSFDETKNIIDKRLNDFPFIRSEDILTGILNKKVGQTVLKNSKNKTAYSIASTLKNYKIAVTGNLGFNYAQVTKGGIDTEDVNPKTFESKIVHNLYLVGETLNVDGDCGGYNLTFAFISGIVAAKNIKKQSKI